MKNSTETVLMGVFVLVGFIFLLSIVLGISQSIVSIVTVAYAINLPLVDVFILVACVLFVIAMIVGRGNE